MADSLKVIPYDPSKAKPRRTQQKHAAKERHVVSTPPDSQHGSQNLPMGTGGVHNKDTDVATGLEMFDGALHAILSGHHSPDECGMEVLEATLGYDQPQDSIERLDTGLLDSTSTASVIEEKWLGASLAGDTIFPTGLLDPTTEGQVPQDVALHATPTQYQLGAGEAMLSRLDPEPGMDTRRTPSRPSLSGSYPAYSNVESPSAENPPGAETDFEDRVKAGQRQDPMSDSPKRKPLHYQDVMAKKGGRARKRRRLHDASSPANSAVGAHEESGLTVRYDDSSESEGESDNIQMNLCRNQNRSFRSDTGLPDGLPSPSSIQSDAKALSKSQPALHRSLSPTGTTRSSLVEQDTSTLCNEDEHKKMGGIGPCESCPILGQAISALVLLPNPPPGYASKRGHSRPASTEGEEATQQSATCKTCTIFLQTINALASLRNPLFGCVSRRARQKLPVSKRTARQDILPTGLRRDLEEVSNGHASSPINRNSSGNNIYDSSDNESVIGNRHGRGTSTRTPRPLTDEGVGNQRQYNLRGRSTIVRDSSEEVPGKDGLGSRKGGSSKGATCRIGSLNRHEQEVGTRRRWSRSDEKRLRRLKESGTMSPAAIAKKLKRSVSAVHQQWRKMCL